MAEMMMIAGAVAAVTGAVTAGESQAQVSNYNAQIANNEAKQGQMAAQFGIEQNSAQTNRLLGMQRAQIAKSGFDVGGSPLLLMEETAYMGSIENQMMQYQADMQSQNMKQSAIVNRKQAKGARLGGVMNAGTSLLTFGALKAGLNSGSTPTT